jgi:hypothetical protein
MAYPKTNAAETQPATPQPIETVKTRISYLNSKLLMTGKAKLDV